MEQPPSSMNPRPGPTTDDYGDGPYFDLEFFIDSDQDNELTSSSSSSSGTCYSRLSCDDGSYCPLPPTDHLIFKRSLEYTNNCKLPNSLFKPTAKLRLLMLRLSPSRPRQQQQQQKVEPEEVRIFSLLSRDGGVRSDTVSPPPSADKKPATKDAIHKYLSKIKPLYFRVSKRYADKIRHHGPLTPGGNKECRQSSSSPVANIRKMLRKSRSASSAIVPAGVPSPPLPVIEEDGIQSAIAHCKKSFDSDKGLDAVLFRSRSDPGGERSGKPN